MTNSINSLNNSLFDDAEISALWSNDSQLGFVIDFEIAFTDALLKAGRISDDAAQTAVLKMQNFQPDYAELAIGVRRDGLLIPSLVKQLKNGLSEPLAIHTGSTSQDALDTALVLTLRQIANIISERLHSVVVLLEELDAKFGNATIMGRTRMQAANPILASHRIKSWKAGITNQLSRLEKAVDEISVLQLGGATGDNSALGEDAVLIANHMASELELMAPTLCWHSVRDGVVEFGNVLSMITGSLGKIGLDIVLMAQQGIDEITLAGGGGSSAMPHKKNPVLAELLVTLARYNAGQVAILHNALVHEQERSGSAWMLEWLTLPQMTITTGAALSAAEELLSKVADIKGSE